MQEVSITSKTNDGANFVNMIDFSLLCNSGSSNSGKGLEVLGLKDAKKIVQLMRLLVSGKIGFIFQEDGVPADIGASYEHRHVKTFTQQCIGYLCSAITTLTLNDPETYNEIMRLCSEVAWFNFLVHKKTGKAV